MSRVISLVNKRDKGNLRTIAGLRKLIQQLPRTMAQDIAAEAAPTLSTFARRQFDQGLTAYGDERPASEVDNSPLTLVQSGRTRKALGFSAIGTIVRASINTKYARYLIGKYAILPSPNSIPVQWQQELGNIVGKFFAKRFRGAA